MPAPLPSNEADRLAALRSYQVLDTAREPLLDEIVSLAAGLTSSPMAAISLVDAERQWFKAKLGLAASETPRDLAFCAHAILDPARPLRVTDATRDVRFADNPLVTGPPDIRAYLGMPLVSPEGFALGTLCVLDRVPRRHDPRSIRAMRTLARAVAVNLELRRSRLCAREMAFTDALTGLPNRPATMADLDRLMQGSRPLAVVSVDLDRLREVNDAEGHDAGDALLRAAASRLRGAVRPGDVVGRVGGDEFVCLLAGVSDRAQAARIAQRLHGVLNQPVARGGRPLRLSATLGLALVPDDIRGRGDVSAPAMALRVADAALARAKQEGNSAIGWAGEGDAARLLHAAAILRGFDEAADGSAAGETNPVAHLQPIVALRDPRGPARRDLIAVEALARWRHPTLGAVPPAELLPVIGPERGARLSAAVRAHALAAFAPLRAECLAGARLALNLSAAEVAQPDIALRLADQVEAAGLSLRDVEIEITEEILLDRVSGRTLDQLAALRGRGARLVLDDFGTGNSGLAQLLRLPLDGLKLDKHFVQRIASDARAREIVRATVSLAHGLDLSVVAEGVETPQQDAMVRALGCDAGQGFLFARPMPPEELRAWLRGRLARHRTDVIALRPKAMRAAAS